MSATQISFLAFATAQASPCTPLVTQAASALVAQPVVAVGGECARVALPRLRPRSRWRSSLLVRVVGCCLAFFVVYVMPFLFLGLVLAPLFLW
jgi:hypothetical protein